MRAPKSARYDNVNLSFCHSDRLNGWDECGKVSLSTSKHTTKSTFSYLLKARPIRWFLLSPKVSFLQLLGAPSLRGSRPMTIKTKIRLFRIGFFCLVGHRGLEPRTFRLRVERSTNWANDPYKLWINIKLYLLHKLFVMVALPVFPGNKHSLKPLDC